MAIRIERAEVFDLRAREAWLEQQAERGWFPGFARYPVWFMHRGTPRRVRYALVPESDGPDGATDQRMLELYREAGWRFLQRADSCCLFEVEELDAQEVFTDDESRGTAMQTLRRQVRSDLLVTLVVLVLAALPCIRPLGRSALGLETFLTVPDLFWVALIWIVVRSVRQICLLGRMKRDVEAGGYRWRGHRAGRCVWWGNLLLTAVYVAAVALMLGSLLMDDRAGTVQLPEGATIPRISQINVDPQRTAAGMPQIRGQLPTLLYPAKQEVWQTISGGTLEKNPLSETPAQPNTATLWTCYWHIRVPGAAERSLREKMEQMGVSGAWTVQERPYEGLDLLITAANNGGNGVTILGAVKDGRAVLYQLAEPMECPQADLMENLDLLLRPVQKGHLLG